MRWRNFIIALLVACLALHGQALAQLEATLEARLDTDNGQAGEVNPQDILEFTLTVRNTGPSTITGINFEDLLHPNTTLVGSEGRAKDDELLLIGTGDITVPAEFGVIQNNDFGSGIAVTSFTATTTRGLSVNVSPDGGFTYSSNGVTGHDSFQYTITDGFGVQSSATANLFIASALLHVNNTAASGGDGSSSAPFSTLVQAENSSAVGNAIFVHTGDGTSVGQRRGITLKEGQVLLGQSSALTVFDESTGQTSQLPTAAPENRPVISDGDTADFATAIILGGNNAVRGLQVGKLSEPKINSKGMFGMDFGFLFMREVSFANSNSYMIAMP